MLHPLVPAKIVGTVMKRLKVFNLNTSTELSNIESFIQATAISFSDCCNMIKQ